MNELKKCPMCGCKSIIQSHYELRNSIMYFVFCQHCKLEMRREDNKQGLIEAWNRRANSE